MSQVNACEVCLLRKEVKTTPESTVFGCDGTLSSTGKLLAESECGCCIRVPRMYLLKVPVDD